jgi:hypothetical protein
VPSEKCYVSDRFKINFEMEIDPFWTRKWILLRYLSYKKFSSDHRKIGRSGTGILGSSSTEYLVLFCMDFVLLLSKFFPAKFFFCILEKGNLAGKNLLGKEGFPFWKIQFGRRDIRTLFLNHEFQWAAIRFQTQIDDPNKDFVRKHVLVGF